MLSYDRYHFIKDVISNMSDYLSIRQRKLLQVLQSQTDYITGIELANFLDVSPRTIRNDIAVINNTLASKDLHIVSQKGVGYRLNSNSAQKIDTVNFHKDLFLSRDERVYYLAFQLSLSELPLNLYDLEDTMFVSRTTLEHDLLLLTKKYTFSYPFISINKVNQSIEFETNERKRRAVLNRLIHEDWNYNDRGSTLYSYNYLDEHIVDLIINEVTIHLTNYNIQLEDTNSVLLNLAIAIMHLRIQKGHELSSETLVIREDKAVSNAVDSIFDSLEVILNCHFSVIERDEIYLHIFNCRLMDASLLSFKSVHTYFSEDIITLADNYLQRVDQIFRIDLSKDEDFYITLLQYLKYLKSPLHLFNMFQVSQDDAKSNLLIEYEIAYLLQQFSTSYIGAALNETEILYLSMLISGSIEYLTKYNSKMLFKTVILCHLNLYATWSIKRKLLAAFENYIDITALLPVNAKNTYDFTDVDLIITTVNKRIVPGPTTSIIHISPVLSKNDYLTISKHLTAKRFNLLCPETDISTLSLISDSIWQENISVSDKLTIQKILYNNLCNYGEMAPDYFDDIIFREQISSFAIKQGIVLLYSLIPCQKTKLSAVTVNHRISWNNQKVRIIMMVSFSPEHYNLLFRLLNDLYNPSNDYDKISSIKTKTEFINYLHALENNNIMN